MRTRTLLTILAVAMATLPALPAVAGVEPTTFFVDNTVTCSNATADSAVTPYCDIQDAVDDASPGDIIDVAAGTYLDEDADDRVVDISTPLTINGAGAGLTILDGQDADIVVRTDSVGLVVIDGVTMTGGGSTGAVLMAGGPTLVLKDSEVKDSAPTGIFVTTGSTLTVDNVTVSGNAAPAAGGGMSIITTSGTTEVVIIDSTFDNNTSAGPGGAIYMGGAGGTGTLDITGTQFLDNDANTSGGAMYLGSAGIATTILQSAFRGNGDQYLGGGTDTDSGGAIYHLSGTLVVDQSLFYENEADIGGAFSSSVDSITIRNTTIHDNHANTQSGGLASFMGTIENSTITGNSSDGYAGGLDADFTTKPTVVNSIIAGNTSTSGAPDCDTIGLGRYNIIGDSTDCSFTTSTGNLLDTDPELLALADNGGPTMTRAFLEGAPPHDAADPADSGSGGNSCRTVDQRDEPRDDARCDMGAFELQVADPSVTRLSGLNRYATAAAISQEFWPDGADTVIIANGAGFPDALAAANLYGENAPLLLVSTDSIPGPTSSELTRLDPSSIIVLGGPAVISDGVATALEAWGVVTRLSGTNRYTTNTAITQHAFPAGVTTVFVASGADFPDALSGGPVAISAGGALLITAPDSLPGSIQTEIERLDPDDIWVLGGTAAVSDTVFGQLDAIAPTQRLAGANRYATAVAISAEFFPGGADSALIATGFNFPDALAGSLASFGSAPMLLTSTDSIPGTVSTEIGRLGPTALYVLGGVSAVSDGVLAALEALIGA